MNRKVKVAKKLNILTGIALICITGLAQSAPSVEYYGVYAVEGGKVTELTQDKTINQEFGPKVQILVFNKNVAQLADHIQIRRMVYVRNEIIVGFGNNFGKPPEVSPHKKWRASKDRLVKTRIKPVPGQPEQVYIVPASPLPPGVYSVGVGGKGNSFFISKNVVLQNLETGPHCVDLEVSDAFASMMGAGGKEVPCNGKSAAPGARGANDTASGGRQDRPRGNVASELSRLQSLPIASADEYKKFQEEEHRRRDQAPNHDRISKLREQAATSARWGRCQQVIDLYNQVLSLDPEDWYAFLMMSSCYNELNQPDQALEYAAKALKRIRYNALYAIVGVAYGAKGERDKFLTWLEKAVDGGSPLNPKALDKSFPQYRDDPRYKAIMLKYQSR